MSLEAIIMPKLGESVTEGTIINWLVKVGESVKKYDPLCEVMTDKVNAEVPSSFSGVLEEIIVQEGETIKVGEIIGYINVGASLNKNVETEIGRKDTPTVITEGKPSHEKLPYKTARYSPAVRKLALEHHLDLTTMKGTGLGGRITRKDVLHFIENKQASTEQPINEAKVTAEIHEKQVNQTESFMTDKREIAVTPIRKTIAQNMVRSKQEIPHAWMTIEVDVTDLVNYRNKVKQSFKEREGFTLTYFPFFIYAVSQALKQYPALNSTWAGDKIIEHKDIHLNIAVAKENELYVPVIKNADDKSIKGIAKAIHKLATKTKNSTLTTADISGGTFTVNNTGTFGSVSSMGIINYPQAAILQVETIVKRPVIINDMFAARDIVNLCLSLDHRILDGLICGKFLATVKEILEKMNEQTIQL